jgi:hypothetical protein
MLQSTMIAGVSKRFLRKGEGNSYLLIYGRPLRPISKKGIPGSLCRAGFVGKVFSCTCGILALHILGYNSFLFGVTSQESLIEERPLGPLCSV